MSQASSATDDASAADVLLVNTCSVHGKVQETVFSPIGERRLINAQRPEIIIGSAAASLQVLLVTRTIRWQRLLRSRKHRGTPGTKGQ